MLGELLPRISSLSYLFINDKDVVVAHCLDLDLVATGSNREIAERRLDTLVRAQVRAVGENLNVADLNFGAPAEQWEAFFEADEFKKTKIEIEVPPIVFNIEQRVSVPVFMRALTATA